MYNFILQAHSGWRYLVLLVLIVALVKFLIGWLAKGKWSNFDTMLNRFTPIVIDIQWLLGLIVWITGSWWQNSDRQGAWEHPLLLTVAVVIAHVFSARARKAESDAIRFRTAFLGYLITSVLVALGVYLVVDSWNLFAM
jgi:phage-related holin